MILLNHVTQNRHEPRAKVLGCIRSLAPWMAETEAEALADKILESPRKYKAVTLGRLLRLTEQEQITLYIETIRPFDKTDTDMKEDRKRRDRESKAAKRAANRSSRPRGRPKSEGVKPWETLGISKATYHRRKRAAMSGTNGETKNASAVLEEDSYTADGISVSHQPVEQPADSRAPEAPRRLAPPCQIILEGEIILDDGDDDGGVALRAPPPNHLQRAIARARRLQMEGGVR